MAEPAASTPRPRSLEIYAGLMSGTSLDGVDGVLVGFQPDGRLDHPLATASLPMPEVLRQRLSALQHPAHDELAQAAVAANELATLYRDCVQALLGKSGLSASAITAIGAHGQTIRHAPAHGYSLQILNAAQLAAETGIDVVHDLRSADIAVGGQGAPLMPAFHAHVFAGMPGRYGILNLGGIANLSILDNLACPSRITGFDTGPANTLLDLWSEHHRQTRFDDRGQWAASGRVIPELLAALLQDPYFALPPPKSTGRDLFNLSWLMQHLGEAHPHAPVDVQATLTALTAESTATAIRGQRLSTVYVCGGGAQNHHLLDRIQAAVGPDTRIQPTTALGIHPQMVEATGFAWLARQRLHHQPIELQSITGARQTAILGALHKAPPPVVAAT
ncbi:MAG: anhydro-N-acetylmuramic acid kinase [Lautropia sp.]|nr:anhydro-N-acetylmuramic acid kinase [Lautropia sp.]